MKYIKLNRNWNAEPNAPDLQLYVSGKEVSLDFKLNPFAFEYIDGTDKGKLEFNNVHAYVNNATNEEGYYRGQYRFQNHLLPWGEFYELFDSNWETDFPREKVEIQPNGDLESARHFIFFFKDSTFECIADSFDFLYQSQGLHQIEEDYPEIYFHHFLAMLSLNSEQISAAVVESCCAQYIAFEGLVEFNNLRLEISRVKEKKDQRLFVKLVNSFNDFDEFGKNEIDMIIGTIESFKA